MPAMGISVPKRSEALWPYRQAGRPHLRQHRLWDTQRPAQVRIPGKLMDVEEHGPGRVAVIGHPGAPLRQFPKQPRVHCPEADLAGFRPGAQARHLLQQPLDLAPREVGINHQAGACPHRGLPFPRLERVADPRRPSALPHDGVADRLPGGAIPQDGGLALVGDPDGGDLRSLHSRGGDRFPCHGKLAFPDLQRVVFHPAGLGVDLPDLALSQRDNPGLPVEQDGPRARGALIQSENVRLHRLTPLR